MRSAPSDRRAGVTLAELLVVILIIGLTAGVTAMSMSALRAPPQNDLARQVRKARSTAISQGRALTVGTDTMSSDSLRRPIRLLPDGRVIGPGFDPWTGALLDERSVTTQ